MQTVTHDNGLFRPNISTNSKFDLWQVKHPPVCSSQKKNVRVCPSLKKTIQPSPLFMYAINIQNAVIGLVLREICKYKQMTDLIAWQSRCHDTI